MSGSAAGPTDALAAEARRLGRLGSRVVLGGAGALAAVALSLLAIVLVAFFHAAAQSSEPRAVLQAQVAALRRQVADDAAVQARLADDVRTLTAQLVAAHITPAVAPPPPARPPSAPVATATTTAARPPSSTTTSASPATTTTTARPPTPPATTTTTACAALPVVGCP
jgi:hypothetical protein